MVLLPKPLPPKDSKNEIARNIFFENETMDQLAKHFVGNNFRLVIWLFLFIKLIVLILKGDITLKKTSDSTTN